MYFIVRVPRSVLSLVLRTEGALHFIEAMKPAQLFHMTKVLVNGTLWGCTGAPEELLAKFKFHRRIALIPIYNSIRWQISTNEILIYT